MQQLFPESDKTVYYKGKQYIEMSAEEVRHLPMEIIINVASMDQTNGGIKNTTEYVTGLRYGRMVLWLLPFRDTFINIGEFAGRKYLYKTGF